MDLAVYFRVIWRFKALVAAGCVLATVLALLSIMRVDFSDGTPKLTYREADVWLSASTLFVTQEGFPWGRAILDETVRVEGGGSDAPTYIPRFGDPGRYSGLAQLYVELAKSDAVRVAVLKGAPSNTWYQPEVVKSSDASAVLPMMYMKGFGPTPEASMAMANRAAAAFREFLSQEQVRNKIVPEKRVRVRVTSEARAAELFIPRSNTKPIFIFVLVVGVFIAIAFVLENLRPRLPTSAPAEDREAAGSKPKPRTARSA